VLLLSKTSFITPLEYASQLYKNPRGIGCQNCHGAHGEGRLVATYISHGKEKRFEGPDLRNLDFKTFMKGLSKSRRGMPKYYLTEDEVKALFLHVNAKVDMDE
jgi:hypothetical protein